MNLRLMLLSFFFLLSSLFLAPLATEAQMFQLYSEKDINVKTSPEIPGPNEQVTIELNSYSINLNNYYISWFENGEARSGGYGSEIYSFTTGNTGEATNITAVVEFGDQIFRKQLRFVPAVVDLLWEVPDAYTPPFYKGKALPVKQSTIKVSAIPETQIIAPTDAPNLVYYWSRNYNRDGINSGFGRQSYTIQADPLNEEEKISVTMNDIREQSFAKNIITIPTNEQNIKTLFFEVNKNGRILTQKALNVDGIIPGDTVRLSFHPLNMTSVKDNFVDLFVEWEVNNQIRPPQDFDNQNELYISSGGQTGNVEVGVTLESIENLLQKHSEYIQIFFQNQ